MSKSYRYLPGDKRPVFAAVIESVISPFAVPVMVVVKLFAIDE